MDDDAGDTAILVLEGPDKDMFQLSPNDDPDWILHPVLHHEARL